MPETTQASEVLTVVTNLGEQYFLDHLTELGHIGMTGFQLDTETGETSFTFGFGSDITPVSVTYTKTKTQSGWTVTGGNKLGEPQPDGTRNALLDRDGSMVMDPDDCLGILAESLQGLDISQ